MINQALTRDLKKNAIILNPLLLFLPPRTLSLSVFKGVMISSNTEGIILSSAFPREDLIFFIFYYFLSSLLRWEIDSRIDIFFLISCNQVEWTSIYNYFLTAI